MLAVFVEVSPIRKPCVTINVVISQIRPLNCIKVCVCVIYLHAASQSILHSAVFFKQSTNKQVLQFESWQLITDLHGPLHINTTNNVHLGNDTFIRGT